jgi:hypothetical protein
MKMISSLFTRKSPKFDEEYICYSISTDEEKLARKRDKSKQRETDVFPAKILHSYSCARGEGVLM